MNMDWPCTAVSKQEIANNLLKNNLQMSWTYVPDSSYYNSRVSWWQTDALTSAPTGW